MGAAQHRRGSRLISRSTDEAASGKRATNEARALLWRSMLDRGCTLTFKANDGGIITAGPYQSAVPERRREYAMFRYGGHMAREHHDSAWGIALRIVENVGRKKPIKSSCPRG